MHGEVVDCPRCKRLACVCQIIREHGKKCRFRISATCPVEIACKHGRGVCPKCDPCTCTRAEGMVK